jgi:hypothetical protein
MAKKATVKSGVSKSAAVKQVAPETLVKRSAATVMADAQPMTAADGGVQPVTTFPPNDCQAGLPPTESFHDVTFAEFKRLNRKIDDLPYPIVMVEIDRTQLPDKIRVADTYGTGASYSNLFLRATAESKSSLEAAGGVPITRALDKSISDLGEPLLIDVHVKDVARIIDSNQVQVGRTPVKVVLPDDAAADLVAARPTLTLGRMDGRDVILRIIPPDAPQPAPLLNEYTVGSADAFLRKPEVLSTAGTPVRVRMSASQMQMLAGTGQVRVSVGGHKVLLRANANDSAAGSAPASASYAATVSRANEGLMGESTRDTALAPLQPDLLTSADAKQTLLPLAVYLPWRHRWVLKGYSRGELLHALALGPQEEVTIEISTWDRRKRTFEDSAQSEFEQTSEFTDTRKNVEGVVRDISNQAELGMTAGANVGFKVGVVDVNASSTASAKAGMANSSKNNLEILRESVTKSSNKLKLQRETKVSESSEVGIENKVTRKVRNPNLCHSLTLNYYEVLAHYDIITEFNKEDARLCVLDDNPVQMNDFNDTNVRYYESVLRRVLLVPDLARGFDGARTLYAQSQLCEAKRRNELCSAPAKMSTSDNAAKARLVDQARRAVEAYATLAVGSPLAAFPHPSPIQFLLPVFWPILTMSYSPGSDSVAKVQRWMYYNRAKQIAPHLFDVLEQLRQAGANGISDSTIQQLAEALSDVKPGSLNVSAIQADKDGLYWMLRRALGVPPVPAVFTDVPENAYAVNDAGLMAILDTFMATLIDIAKAQEAQEAKALMEANQDAVATDYSNKELAEALEAVEALKFHLNQYRNYYRTQILSLLPFPDAFNDRLNALPLVERRVLGFDGGQVALPIRAELDPRTDLVFRTLVTENEQLVSMRTTQQVTLPTSGIHVETRLGNCVACEDYIVQIRRRDLQLKSVEIDLKQETLAQQKVETARLQARVDADDLGDPIARTPSLRVELDPPIQLPKPSDVPPNP